MALKRIFSTKDKKNCICLKCGTQIEPDRLKDNSIYTCAQCGQKMTVDRNGSRATLTVIERQDLRRRTPPEITGDEVRQAEEILKLIEKNETLKSKLDAANGKIAELRREAEEWQQAADGLARMIEEMNERERRRGNV